MISFYSDSRKLLRISLHRDQLLQSNTLEESQVVFKLRCKEISVTKGKDVNYIQTSFIIPRKLLRRSGRRMCTPPSISVIVFFNKLEFLRRSILVILHLF